MNNITNTPNYITEEGDQILFPFSPPIFKTEVDSNFTKELVAEGRKLINELGYDQNHKLASRYDLSRTWHYKNDYLNKVEPYLKIYVERFFNSITQKMNTPDMVNSLLSIQEDRMKFRKGNLKLDNLFINFNQKNDFNPPHTHTGILSFVIFCKIPDGIFKDHNEMNTMREGELHFSYGDTITKLMKNTYPIRPYENSMYIFPNELRHYVPGYSYDAERISVSGNFVVV